MVAKRHSQTRGTYGLRKNVYVLCVYIQGNVVMYAYSRKEIEHIKRLSQTRGTDGLRKDMYVLCVYVSENVWRN